LGEGCGSSCCRSLITVATERRGGSGRRRNILRGGWKWVGGTGDSGKEVITKAVLTEVKNVSSYGA
jgi:hypothetical protein